MVEENAFRGFSAAPYVFITEIFQSMVVSTFALNLCSYLFKYLHYVPTFASSALSNFMGTQTLIALLGGFLSDTYISQFAVLVVGEILAAIGSLILTTSATVSKLRPPPCPLLSPTCEEPNGIQEVALYSGLYLVAFGLGLMKPNIPSLGAAQFNENDPVHKKQLLGYFNWFFFCTALGAFPAVTLISYAQEQISQAWGFIIPTILFFFSIFIISSGYPYQSKARSGSVLTRVVQVFVAATRNWKQKTPSEDLLYDEDKESARKRLAHTDQFTFLDKAAIDKKDPANQSLWKQCTLTQVEEIKSLIRLLPIFASTIMINCVLAQLQTFTLQQGNTLERNIKTFEVPLASLAALPMIMIIVILPAYDRLFVPFARRITGHERGITHLQRISIGLFMCIISMVVAALVETKRLSVARENNFLDNPRAVLPMSAAWLTIQFAIFGVAEMFTLVGLLDFFYSESPENMRTMGIALLYVSISFGYFLSSVIVSQVNKYTEPDWLPGNINRGKLHHFYWFLSVLSTANFFNYLFWSRWYKPTKQHLIADESGSTATDAQPPMHWPSPGALQLMSPHRI